MSTIEINVKIDLSDSLKQFLKSLIPQKQQQPTDPFAFTPEDTFIFDDEYAQQLEGQISIEPPKISKDDLIALGGEVVKLGENKTLIDILKKYGAVSLPQLNSIHYNAVYDDLKAALNELAG